MTTSDPNAFAIAIISRATAAVPTLSHTLSPACIFRSAIPLYTCVHAYARANASGSAPTSDGYDPKYATACAASEKSESEGVLKPTPRGSNPTRS